MSSPDQISRLGISRGSLSLATARTTMSRSVIIPTSRSPSRMGIAPTSWLSISSATWLSGVSGAAERGLAVIASPTIIYVQPPSSTWRRLLSPTSRVRERLPLLEPPFDECCPLSGVVAVQHGDVTGVGPEVDPGGPRVAGVGAFGARGPVAVGAVDALQVDLTGRLEPGSVRMAGTFALREVEDARRIDAFLRRLAPVTRGQRAVGLPCPPRDLQGAGAITADGQQRDRGRLELRSGGEGQLPPITFQAADPAFGRDCLPQLLVDLTHDGRRGVGVVPDRGQTEQVGRGLGTVRVEDERPADTERTPEQARFENDIVAR